jgi:hypothetical protein
MNWKNIDLNGAGVIARVCSVYEVGVTRVPGAGFKIKVLEYANGYVAFPSICIRSAGGTPEWTSGSGESELEALQAALKNIMADLGTEKLWAEEELEWSDPRDF